MDAVSPMSMAPVKYGGMFNAFFALKGEDFRLLEAGVPARDEDVDS